jgi:hydroxymethylpyrimidine/phosphomethylpyrimidine kinase
VRDAKAYLTSAIAAADQLIIGGTGAAAGEAYSGHGPVHHFAGIWPAPGASV